MFKILVKNLIWKSDIVILRDDKDSSVVIMSRSDYIQKLEGAIEEGVKSTYKKTEDTTLQDLKKIFCIGISIHTNVINLCIHIVISL